MMRAKLMGGNHLILPDEIARALHGIEYVDVELRDSCLLLTPLGSSNLDDVYEKIERLGITEKDISDAVAWARKGDGQVETGT